MIHLLLPLFLSSSAPSFDTRWDASSTPLRSALPSEIPGTESDDKWDRAGVQFLSGTVGASIGSLGGAAIGGLTGYLIGEAASNGKDRCEDAEGWCFPASFGTAVFGGMIGAGALGMWTSATFVRLAAPDNYPSSGIGMGMLGSTLGAMGGFVIIGATSKSVDWEFWPGFAVVMASSSAGAVIFDRGFALDRHLSISPWVPRPGLEGAKLSMAF